MGRLALLLVASLFFTLSLAASFDGIVNKEVKREVDLTSQLTVQSSVITVQNTGAKEATTYYLAVYEGVAPNVADVAVTDASGAKLAIGASETASGYAPSPSPSLTRPHPAELSARSPLAPLQLHSLPRLAQARRRRHRYDHCARDLHAPHGGVP